MLKGEPSDVQVLRSIRYELARYIGPLATDGKAATTLRMVDDALAFLILRKEIGADALRADNAQLETILAGSVERDDGADPAARHRRLLEQVEQTLLRAGDAQADPQPVLGGLLAMHDAALVRTTRFAAEDARLYGERRATLESGVDGARFQAYLHRHFPERKPIVTDFRELSGGFSKSTFLVDLEGLEDAPCSVVVKRDMSASATRTSAVEEFPLLKGLFDAGIPVPEPLWTEEDARELDYPFLVMRKVPGETAGTLFGPGENCTEQTVRDLAATLGRLHGLDPAALDLGSAFAGVGDPHDAMLREVAHWRAVWHETRLDPDPLLAGAMAWLERNIPPLPARLSIVHGDPGFQNIMCAEGRLTSIIDWEFTHPGDPIENLVYLRPHIEQRLPWADFMAIYQAHGGGGYDEDLATYYQVWRGVRFTVLTLLANRAFCTDANPELRMGHCGMIAYRPIVRECGAMARR